MGRYFTESDTKEKVEIFNISSSEIDKLKAKTKHKQNRVKALKYSKEKHDKKAADPFPGRKPVDPEKVEEHSRGEKINVKKVKTKFKQRELKRREKQLEFAAEQAARAEILLAEEAGFLQGDEDQEFTGQITQAEIRRAVDPESAAKSFDLNLPEFGPYKISYTR